MTIILGIDPGSRKTGYGVIRSEANAITYLDCGVINLGAGELSGRLLTIFEALNEVITLHRPNEAAIESVFMQINVRSALVLGHARGAAMLTCANHGLSVEEYAPKAIKQAVVGTGAAKKAQIQLMMRHLLKLSHSPKEDAADALAIAICHAHSKRHQAILNQVKEKEE